MAKEKKLINFIGKKNLWYVLSALILILSFTVVGFRYIVHKQTYNYGIDFTGGSSIVIRFDYLDNINRIQDKEKKSTDKNIFLAQSRELLKQFSLEDSTLQFSEGKDLSSEDLMLKTKPLDNETRKGLLDAFEKRFGKMELIESDTIGPSIGAELAKQSLVIAVVALVLLLIYITFRFDFPYAAAAIIALIHDVLITIGLAGAFHFQIDTSFVAAILTILGFSVHDTIVIFDRIRENVPTYVNKKSIFDIANISINQTLARSINTYLTVEFTLVSLLVFGGETIKTFSLVMFIGIFFGAYSSICIASPIFVGIKKWQGLED